MHVEVFDQQASQRSTRPQQAAPGFVALPHPRFDVFARLTKVRLRSRTDRSRVAIRGVRWHHRCEMSDASEPKIAAHSARGSAPSFARAEPARPAPPLPEWPVAGTEPAQKDGALYRYLPALDGLRAVSILWVLSVHWPRNLPLSELGFVKRGAFGVEIFFAISGFLVTRSLQQCVVRAARERGTMGAVFRDFIVRRIARIWPPYFLAILVALAGMVFDGATRGNLVIFQPIAWSFPTFLANYTISRHYTPLSLLVMWSLCFEEQFYVILIVLYLIGKKSLTKYIVGAALASIALRLFATALQP